MLKEDAEDRGFCGAYGIDDNAEAIDQQLTPVRDTVEEVVADLRAVRQRRRRLRLAQIIDLKRLEPIEPAATTMARLK
jgi:hypothetical protein